jgi:aryl-alcohol dehydrogenase-like predicted oxidoreductase
MQYSKLGKTGLEVSRICLGMMSYGNTTWQGWVLGEEDARKHIHAALDMGINFFDTADAYSRGKSEEITGKILRETGIPRDELVLATKVFFPFREGEGPNRQGLSRKHILDACDASLKRLGLDYIDLYQIHRWDSRTPIEETLEALDSVVRAGKVRYLGASSMAAWQFAKALYTARERRWHAFVSMQNHYNLVYREEEREMIPLCMEEGVGVIPWSPLARGLLARGTQEITTRKTTDEFGKRLYGAESDKDVVAAVETLAREKDVPPARIALAWILGSPGVTAPIIGATKLEHLQDAVASLDLVLTPEERARLEEPYQPHPVLGHTQPKA